MPSVNTLMTDLPRWTDLPDKYGWWFVAPDIENWDFCVPVRVQRVEDSTGVRFEAKNKVANHFLQEFDWTNVMRLHNKGKRLAWYGPVRVPNPHGEIVRRGDYGI